MTELGQGDVGETGYGSSPTTVSVGGASHGNISGQPDVAAIQLKLEQEYLKDLQHINEVQRVGANYADLQIIAKGLTASDKAALATNDNLPLLTKMKYAFEANAVPASLSMGLPFGMATIGQVIGAMQTMATGTVGVTPDADTSQAGASKTIYEWMNDPVAIAEMQKLFPGQQASQITAEVKSQADKAVASAFLGAKPSGGSDLNDYDQNVDSLVKNWNTGKGGFDKANELGTPRWLSDYLRAGMVPEFFKPPVAPIDPVSSSPTVFQNAAPAVNNPKVFQQPGLITQAAPQAPVPATPQAPAPGTPPAQVGLLNQAGENSKMTMESPV